MTTIIDQSVAAYTHRLVRDLDENDGVRRGLPPGGPPAFYAPLAPIDPPTQED